MRVQEFIRENKTASNRAILKYVQSIHQQDDDTSRIRQMINRYPRWELREIPLSQLEIPDPYYPDDDAPERVDPYGRTLWVDYDYAGEVSAHNVDRLPIVVDPQGNIIDGNHRAWAAAELLNRDSIQAWVAVPTVTEKINPEIGQDRSRTRLLKLPPAQQEVNEVQILAKVKGKGSEPSQIPRYGRPIEPDQETRYLGQQVGRLGRYQLWRDWLGGQLSYHVFDPGSRTVVLTTFGSRYHRNPNSYIIHGLYAAPGNPVKAHQFYRNLILDQGLTLISDRKQSPGGNRVWQRLEAYPDIEVYGFDTRTGEVMNFGAADAEMYAVPPRAAKDRESRYIAKNIRLVATAR